MQPHQTADRLIYACIAGLILFGVLAFLMNPAYEKGAWVVIGALVSALSGACGFKFGVTQSNKPTPPPTVP